MVRNNNIKKTKTILITGTNKGIGFETASQVHDFYLIALKRNYNAKFRYGWQQYDFDEGVMSFVAPNQVFGVEHNNEELLKLSGRMLFVHPDFLWNTPLAKTIIQ